MQTSSKSVLSSISFACHITYTCLLQSQCYRLFLSHVILHVHFFFKVSGIVCSFSTFGRKLTFENFLSNNIHTLHNTCKIYISYCTSHRTFTSYITYMLHFTYCIYVLNCISHIHFRSHDTYAFYTTCYTYIHVTCYKYI